MVDWHRAKSLKLSTRIICRLSTVHIVPIHQTHKIPVNLIVLSSSWAILSSSSIVTELNSYHQRRPKQPEILQSDCSVSGCFGIHVSSSSSIAPSSSNVKIHITPIVYKQNSSGSSNPSSSLSLISSSSSTGIIYQYMQCKSC